MLESGTRPSLDRYCHHQITHCKINIKLPPPPPYDGKLWQYHQANVKAIRRSISNFPWQNQLDLNRDPNWQVDLFTVTILNIMAAFIPNETKRIKPRDPSWISSELKTLLKKKNRLYASFKRNGYRENDRVNLEAFRFECKEAVDLAKKNHISNLGNKLNDPTTPSKSYWKIIHKVMNRARLPVIPPILVDNILVINCIDKCKQFASFFSKQCKIIANNSTLPPLNYLTDHRIDSLPIDDAVILSLIRNLNHNKAMGPDGISAHMLILADESVVLPLKLIYSNILNSSIYPDQWKLANVTPIHNKQQITGP